VNFITANNIEKSGLMNKSQNKMREQLIYLLEVMDDNLLQRVYDYTNGLLVGLRDNEVNDWWNDLTPEQQQQIEKGLTDIEQDNLLSENEMNQAVKALFDKN
jgi:hypothetical protein